MENTFDRIVEILRAQCDLDESVSITMDTTFKDIDLDSLDVVEIALECENEFGITIDEMLVYIPQLTKRKSKLAEMKSKLPKYRVAELGRISNIIDYTYLNYDLSEVEADYARVSDELANAQLALDAINNRDTLELPF